MEYWLQEHAAHGSFFLTQRGMHGRLPYGSTSIRKASPTEFEALTRLPRKIQCDEAA